MGSVSQLCMRSHPMLDDMGLGAEIVSIPNMLNHSFLEAPARLTIVHSLPSSFLPLFLRGGCFVCLGLADQAYSFIQYILRLKVLPVFLVLVAWWAD